MVRDELVRCCFGLLLYRRFTVAAIACCHAVQVFGRAGRPQYDTSGEAIMITTHKSLDR